jgi:hypothetical protein
VPAQRLDISLADGNRSRLEKVSRPDYQYRDGAMQECLVKILRSFRCVEKAALGKSTEMANLQLGTYFRIHVVESRRRECAFVGYSF